MDRNQVATSIGIEWRLAPEYASQGGKLGNVLIIDDDRSFNGMLSEMVKRMGHHVHSTFTLQDGLRTAREIQYDVVLLDVMMPDGSGLNYVQQIKNSPFRPEVIVMTSTGKQEDIEIAIKNGAWDYVEKPSPLQKIRLPLIRALQYKAVRRNGFENNDLKIRAFIVGNSPAMKTIYDQVSDAACSDMSVLVTGETGTGKELISQAIHKNSCRRDKNFVVVDCAALPETLIESTLFGHEKGAFTGADQKKEGLVRQAHKGTLFLDEIGELSLHVQRTFLRVLQEKKVRPLGGSEEINSDFRLIAATNRNLEDLIKEGKFRKDLYYRLRSLVIDLPPLRERIADIKEIATFHTEKICYRLGLKVKELQPEFIEYLSRYSWPGNVRELVNTLERAISASRKESRVVPQHLPDDIRISIAKANLRKDGAPSKEPISTRPSPVMPTLSEHRESELAKIEQQYMNDLLKATAYNLQAALEVSGLSKTRFYELTRKYKIPTKNAAKPE